MSSMMNRMPKPKSANPTQQAIEDTRSMLNPTDLAAIKQEGEITPDMSIRDFFQTQGIDVDGPVSQLVEWNMKQIENADPLNKMKAIASSGGGENEQVANPAPGTTRFPQGRKPAVQMGLQGLRTALQGGA